MTTPNPPERIPNFFEQVHDIFVNAEPGYSHPFLAKAVSLLGFTTSLLPSAYVSYEALVYLLPFWGLNHGRGFMAGALICPCFIACGFASLASAIAYLVSHKLGGATASGPSWNGIFLSPIAIPLAVAYAILASAMGFHAY